MSMNNELEKKESRLLASKLPGTSIADSFTVSNKCSLWIYTVNYGAVSCGKWNSIMVKEIKKNSN